MMTVAIFYPDSIRYFPGEDLRVEPVSRSVMFVEKQGKLVPDSRYPPAASNLTEIRRFCITKEQQTFRIANNLLRRQGNNYSIDLRSLFRH